MSNNARIFCFRHKPTGKLRKIQSDTRRKALTRIVTQAEPTWERGDVELVWEDSIERVYGVTNANAINALPSELSSTGEVSD